MALSASAAAVTLTSSVSVKAEANAPADKSRKKIIVGMPVRPGSEDLDRAAMVLWASAKSHVIEEKQQVQDDGNQTQVDDDEDLGFSLFD